MVEVFDEKYFTDCAEDIVPFAGYCLALSDEELAQYGWEIF